jgi:integrase/recombinase XerD
MYRKSFYTGGDLLYLQDVLKEFLYHIEIQNYSKRTQKGYKNNNLAFIKYLSNEFQIDELEDVRTQHIKSYLMYLKNKGRKESYVNTILKSIRAFFNYCVEEGYITQKQNPCTNVKWMKEPKTLIKTFSDEEIVRMLNVYKMNTYMQARNKLILMMFIDTGIRATELCQLTHNDIFETTIRIHGKGNKHRYIYISPMLKKYMIKYERIKNAHFKDSIQEYNNYFLSYRGKPLTVEAVERVVRLAGEKAKVRKIIRCSPHTLRHTFGQQQLRNGLDLYSLSRLMGHEDIQITKRYLQSIEDEKIIEIGRNTSPLMNLRG